MNRQRLGLLAVIVLFTLVVRGGAIESVWSQNMALKQLLPAWLVHHGQLIHPPCQPLAEMTAVINLLQSGVVQASAPPRLQTHLGRALWMQGDCNEAIHYWQQAVQGGEPFAGYELARVGEVDLVPSELRLILAEQAYHQAVNLRDAGNQPASQIWYRQAFDLALQHRSASALAVQFERQGQVAQAQAVWHKMVDGLSPADADYWWATAQLDQSASEWMAAAEAYTQGAKLSADPYEYWLSAGRAWEKTSQWDQAVTAYEEAVGATPYPSVAYADLGLGYSNRGDYQQALQYLSLARDADPKYDRPYYYLGLTYFRMQEFENARRNLELALERNPDDASVMHVLAQVWSTGLNQPELADMWQMRAITKLDSPPATWWLELGDWRLAQRQCASAAQAYAAARSAGANESALRSRKAKQVEQCGSSR